jgi:hypothetical protein
MPAKIPAHIREQQINDLPNISFVRWVDGYRNNRSKAICRCDLDGHEWAAEVNSLVNQGKGCPECGVTLRVTAEETRIQQINDLPNISFVRWVDGYRNNRSKAICRCDLDGYECAASADGLVNGRSGCHQCAGVRRWTAEERIRQINSLPNISFVRWADVFKNAKSKAVCRCEVDGYEWAAEVNCLVNARNKCPQCTDRIPRPAEKRIAQINALPNIFFVRWADVYKNSFSKAVCRCDLDGHEWATAVDSLLNAGTGCPACAQSGFNPATPGTLYILRSECGTMVKIGISNNHEQRHGQLKRATPFDWHCIELLHSDDGSLIAELEKELHSWTEQAEFREPFDGYTEWRKWDDRLPRWIKRYRARLARYNKAP